MSWDIEHVLVDFQWGGDGAVDPPIGEVICSASDHTDCGPRNLDIHCVLDLCNASADVRFVGQGGWQPLAAAADGTLTFEDVVESSQCGWTETTSGTFEIDPGTLALTGEIRLDRVPLATDTCTGSSQLLTVSGTFAGSSTCDAPESCSALFAGEVGVWGFERPPAWADLSAWGE